MKYHNHTIEVRKDDRYEDDIYIIICKDGKEIWNFLTLKEAKAYVDLPLSEKIAQEKVREELLERKSEKI